MLEPLKSCGSVRWKAAARTAIDAVPDPTGPKVRLYRPCCGRLSMSMPALGCVCGELVQCSWRLWAILSCAKSVQSKRFRRQPQVEKTGPLQSSLVARECLPISGACEQPQRPNIPKERAQIDMCSLQRPCILSHGGTAEHEEKGLRKELKQIASGRPVICQAGVWAGLHRGSVMDQKMLHASRYWLTSSASAAIFSALLRPPLPRRRDVILFFFICKALV